ncbi:fimbrial protein [Klebsiella pneumoniae]|uniref:fimbrial protein n=2 Tax=Klebsiella pneumoniae TaxID=573 RepID=UPI0003BE4D25|nr:type 1 fimbrial protein [Klebsiella pneumoniae]EKX7964190.1 type 1 fimbrial protein [Klebsiella pneumoniae]ESM08787.1 hypothetical protein L419_00257 [Klebsiella pneumoniae UCICRE 8]HDS6154987.1 type 1 fimbrial protein [Klebsiella pneumoniae]
MGLFNATLVMVSYLFISLFGVVLAKENSFILGRVNMQGAIIDTACTISFGNQKQTIDMGMLSLSELVRHGTSRSWFFSIKLTNCMSGYNKADSLKNSMLLLMVSVMENHLVLKVMPLAWHSKLSILMGM